MASFVFQWTRKDKTTAQQISSFFDEDEAWLRAKCKCDTDNGKNLRTVNVTSGETIKTYSDARIEFPEIRKFEEDLSSFRKPSCKYLRLVPEWEIKK